MACVNLSTSQIKANKGLFMASRTSKVSPHSASKVKKIYLWNHLGTAGKKMRMLSMLLLLVLSRKSNMDVVALISSSSSPQKVFRRSSTWSISDGVACVSVA